MVELTKLLPEVTVSLRAVALGYGALSVEFDEELLATVAVGRVPLATMTRLEVLFAIYGTGARMLGMVFWLDGATKVAVASKDPFRATVIEVIVATVVGKIAELPIMSLEVVLLKVGPKELELVTIIVIGRTGLL